MSRREWEDDLDVLGEKCWDEATELTRMIADESYPAILNRDETFSLAARTVIAIATDPDYRRCIEGLWSGREGAEA